MAYAAVGGGWTLNMRLDSPIRRIAYKSEHPDFAGYPIDMRQVHGLYCGRRGLNAKPVIRLLGQKELNTEPAIRFSDQKDSTQKRAP